MPINIDFLHFKLEQGYNKLSNNHQKYLTDVEKDEVLNTAIFEYLEIFIHGRNPKNFNIGFEVTQQRIDMLQTLIARNSDGTMLSYPAVQLSTGEYAVDLSTFDPKYRHFLRAYVVPSECTNKKIPVTITRLNDLDTKLDDDGTKPSLAWKRCLGSIKSNNLILYTGTDFTISEVYIEYLKNPVKVFYGGYNTLEFESGDTMAYQSGSPQVTSDLPETYHDLLVDMVVQYLSQVLEDGNKFQLQEKTILNKV